MPGGHPVLVGVLGGGEESARILTLAAELGAQVALRGWWLVSGGLGGVMNAACRGAREAGGHTIGILPGTDRRAANPWVEIPIVTGMADARNVLIVRTAHVCVAVGGAFGTLSEIAFCLKFGTPILALESRWAAPSLLPELETVATPGQACERIAQLARTDDR
jgi:hypothetical protein